MNQLQERADSFFNLLDVEYRIILGRKGKQYKINITFQPFDFPHLIGLHKLSDRISGHISNDAMFYKCLDGLLSFDHIAQSKGFAKLGKRFTYFNRLEEMFDSNETVFKCNSDALSSFSSIKGDYLLENHCDGYTFYIFLAKRPQENEYFCKTFLHEEKIDYTYRQTKMTMLYKEKVNRKTGETIVQYNRLS